MFYWGAIMKLTTKLVALCCAIFMSGAASAAVISNVSGIVCEYDGQGACPSGSIQPDDFDGAASDPTLQLVGDTTILGFVAHRSVSNFIDAWTIDFGSAIYSGAFSWRAKTADVDGVLIVGGVEVYSFSTAGGSSVGSTAIGPLTGVVTFVVDPIAGKFGPNPDEEMWWKLELTQVPLPAGGWLILTGLGGLALARRTRG